MMMNNFNILPTELHFDLSGPIISSSDEEGDIINDEELIGDDEELIGDNEKMQMNLRVNCLLDSINDEELIRECLNQISESLGGNKKLLYFLSNNSSKMQLESMFENIKKIKLNKEVEKDFINNTNNDYFLLIPDEQIGNDICPFLTKDDLYSFKQTSKQIGIECLKNQRKINIHIFDSNQLLNRQAPLNKYYKFKTISKSRHNLNKRIYKIFERIHIPRSQQLILIYNPLLDRLTLFDLKKDSNLRINSLRRYQRHFILLDNQKIVLMNGHMARKFDIKTDQLILKHIENYNLMILEYYDIFNMQSNIVQFILYPRYANINIINIFTLIEYIQNDFVYINEMNNQWHIQLKEYLKKMNHDPNNKKLSVYKHYTNRMELIGVDECGASIEGFRNGFRCSFFTFQLNLNHIWVKQMNKFRLNAKQFCIDEMKENAKYVINIYILFCSCLFCGKWPPSFSFLHTVWKNNCVLFCI
eukprot:160665_1